MADAVHFTYWVCMPVAVIAVVMVVVGLRAMGRRA